MRGTVDVHRYLVERGIPHEFYRLERPLRRIDEAARLLGLPAAQVAAVELFIGPAGPVVAIVPAGSCASAIAVAAAAGAARVRAASAARTLALTGFLPGWLPPVGHDRPGRSLIDPDLTEAGALYAAGGDPGVMLTIRSADLVRAAAATVTPLSAPAAARETAREARAR